MYLLWPELEDAYAAKNQYMYGDDLLVAPVITPAEPSTGLASTEVWLPPGKWTHWFTGKVYEGPAHARVLSALDQFPLLVREGAIIPTMLVKKNTSEKLDGLLFEVFGGATGKTRVYEDDGLTQGYLKNDCAWTPVTFKRDASGKLTVTVGPRDGIYKGMDDRRHYGVRVHDVTWPTQDVKINGEECHVLAKEGEAGWGYLGKELAAAAASAATSASEKCIFEFVFEKPGPMDMMFKNGVREGATAVCNLAASLGADAPPKLKETAKSIEQLESKWDQVEATLAPLKGQTTSLLEGITPEMVQRPAVREAIARLLGLDLQLTVAPMNVTEVSANSRKRSDERMLVARLMARIAPPLGGSEGMTLDVKLDPIGGWKADEKLSSQSSGGDGRSAMLVLEPRDGPALAEIRGRVAIKSADTSFVFPVERTVFPSISRWWVFGPFDGEPAKSLNTEYPPEQLLLAESPPSAAALEKAGGKKVERTFSASDDPTGEFVVNLNKTFAKPKTNSVAYGFIYLVSEQDADAVLAMGSDDGCLVWLNGKEVHRVNDPRAYNPKADRVKIRLNKGVNRLLVKINQGVGGWEFAAHIDTPEGQPMTGVRAAWQAPTDSK